MGDVMDIARKRQSQLEADIAAREQEILDMRSEIESLAKFLEFGDELMRLDGTETGVKMEDTAQKEEAKPADDADFDMDDEFDPFEDEEDLGASVAQLHGDRPRSRPMSRPA